MFTFLHLKSLVSHVTCHVSRVTCLVSHVTSSSQAIIARELKFWEKLQLSPPVTCHVSCVTCHMSYVTCHMSPVMCHISHVTHHMSHVMCHVSHVTCHIILLFLFFFWTNWWSYLVDFLLSTGLTRLVTSPFYVKLESTDCPTGQHHSPVEICST